MPVAKTAAGREADTSALLGVHQASEERPRQEQVRAAASAPYSTNVTHTCLLISPPPVIIVTITSHHHQSPSSLFSNHLSKHHHHHLLLLLSSTTNQVSSAAAAASALESIPPNSVSEQVKCIPLHLFFPLSSPSPQQQQCCLLLI